MALGDRLMQSDEPRSALQASRLLLKLDGCDEQAHRLAFRAYARLNDQAGLDRQWQRCATVLTQKLHTHPSKETVSLLSRLSASMTAESQTR